MMKTLHFQKELINNFILKREFLFFLVFIFSLTLSFGQVTIRSQSFDSGASGYSDNLNYTTAGTATVTNTSSESAPNSIQLSSNNSLALFDNVDISSYTNVTATVSFSSLNANNNKDLFLDVSYNNGTNWTSIKLIDGENGAGGEDWNWNTPDDDGGAVTSNPYSFSIPNTENTVRLRVRASQAASTRYFNVDNILIEGISTTSCPGTITTFYDSGGAGGNYSDYENQIWTFFPDGGPVTATFTAFSLENTYDYLYVYDGPNTGSPLIGAFTGNTIPGPFTSTHISQTLTFEFYSDVSNTEIGWAAAICGTPPPPPTNDDCSGAIEISPNTNCITTTGTTISATESQTGCTGNADDDVWYYFTATNTEHTITVSEGSINDIVFQVFEAPSSNCSTLNNLGCIDDYFGGNDEVAIGTGFIVGEVYFIRVYSFGGNGNQGTFDICVTHPTPPCTITDPINTTPTVCPLIAGEQGVDPFSVVPFDPDPSFSLDCSSPTLTLQAHSTIRETDSYTVEQIAFPSPAPDFNFPTFGGAGVQTIASDDVWADTRTNIGFNFCFYGNTYTQTLVGANGMITFDPSYTPGASCGYAFSSNLPSLAGALFNNTIYGVYHDIDPTGLTGTPIKSKIEGTPGCRQFIVSWHDIPMFRSFSSTGPDVLYTGMIVLHETTNIIEVFIEEKRLENNNINPWNDGNAIVGLQGDANAGEAITAPCRNGLDTNWETTNEAWRFVPNGAIITPDSVEWFSASTGSTILGTNSTLTVTTPDTYTAEVTYTSCGNTVTFSDDVVVDQASKTWMGYIDNNWYIDGNWEPNGVPTASDCVLIPDVSVSNIDFPIADVSNRPPPIPPPSAFALNLTVATTASLDVLANTNLVVTDWIHLDGTINIRNTGSLIQVNDGATNINNNTGNGNVNMQRTATIASSYDYIYWSSPVEGFGVSNVSPGSSLIYEWIPTIPTNAPGGYGNWQATTENMINGKGYIIRNIAGTPTPSTPEFIGRPNNGIITKAITRGTYNAGDYSGGGNTIATRLDDNWNLIGNPYPSAISANTFLNVNAVNPSTPAITGTVYLWRHLAIPSNAINDPFYEDFVYNYNPNDYIAYNGTGSNPPGFGGDIAAGQAFFVLMEHTAPVNSNVLFNNTMRNETLNNSQFYRESQPDNRSSNIEKNRIWLDLISPNNTANSILVGYIEGASNNFDRLFDGHELSETSTRFYSIIDSEELGIQGKALPFEETDIVPLGIVIPENGNYTIAINTLDGLFQDTDQEIYIEDTYTNTMHNLQVNPFSFNIEAGTYNDRFILRYNNPSLSIDDYEISELEIIAPNNSFIKVKTGNSIIKTVIVYDLLGRTLINKTEINTSEISFNNHNFSEGTYIVKAILINGKQKIQKVVLKL